MTDRQIQSEECFEHHMTLKKELTRISNFLFGDPEHATCVSFTSKVNLMFDELKFIKQFLIGSMFTIIGFFFYAGGQMQKLDTAYQKLDVHLKEAQKIELRLTQLEIKSNEKDNSTLDGGRL